MWNKIIIFFISFLTLLFLLYGVKNITGLAAPHMKTLKKRKKYSGAGIPDPITGKGRSRKILVMVIFLFLILIFYIISGNFIFGLFAGICPGIYITDYMHGLEEKRKDLLNTQLVEFLNNMIVMLKAGYSVRSIFKTSADCFKNPLGSYLKETANELGLNSTLEETLDRFSKRCGSREVQLMVSSLKINSKIGGDLIPVLDKVADNIRHNLKLKSQVRTMSLQSRYSGNIISIFPVVILILMYIFLSERVMDFFSTGIGLLFLIAGGILEVAGILIIKKITGVKNYIR